MPRTSIALLGGVAGISAGIWLLWNTANGPAWQLILLGAVLIVAAGVLRRPVWLATLPRPTTASRPAADLVRYWWAALAIATALAVGVGVAIATATPYFSDWDLLRLWLIAMLVLLGLVLSPLRALRRRPRALRWRHVWRPDRAALLAVLALAVVTRLFASGAEYPVYGDEAYQAQLAQTIVSSPQPGLFTLDFMDISRMYYLGLGFFLHVVGGDLVAARLYQGLWGIAAIAATYLLVRELCGPRLALLTSLLLIADPLHLRYSRLALFNIWVTFTLPLALFFLLRGLRTGRASWWMAAGLTAGLAQYGHTDARFLLLLVILVLGYEALATWRSLWAQRWNVALLGLCAVLAYMPTLAYVSRQPSLITARASQISIFQSGWLAQQSATVGIAHAIGSQVWSNLSPLLTVSNIGDWIYPLGALLSPWSIPLAVVGILHCVMHARQRPQFIALAWALLVFILGGVMVIPQFQSVHFVSLAAPITIFVALGVAWVGELAPVRLRLPVVVGLVALLMGSGLYNYFVQYWPVPAVYQINDDTATEVARYLRGVRSDTTVYFFSAPTLNFHSQPQASFLSGRTDVVDVFGAAPSAGLQPGRGGAVFFFLPSRLDQLGAVQRRFPRGRVNRLPHAYVPESSLVTVYVVAPALRSP